MTRIPVNGAGAVDLGALKATEQQKALALIGALNKAGLVCRCGQRIRGRAVEYFVPVEGMFPTAQGPRRGIKVNHEHCCSTICVAAAAFEASAIARRDPSGNVVWLDELRAKQAAAN